MKKIICIFSVFVMFSQAVVADEITVIHLDEGANTITLSIVNDWNNDLSNVTVKVDKENLPKWLKVQVNTQPIDVRSGTKGYEKLYLILNVTGAHHGAVAEVPFTLQDEAGNQWNYNASIQVNASKPLEYALHANYPNPFNPTTTIRYALKESRHTKLVIFNSLGQKIRTLVNEPQTGGIHAVHWDGRNDNGEHVSSGLYFYRLESGSFEKTRRMMLLK